MLLNYRDRENGCFQHPTDIRCSHQSDGYVGKYVALAFFASLFYFYYVHIAYWAGGFGLAE
jgi:hypothetical protein